MSEDSSGDDDFCFLPVAENPLEGRLELRCWECGGSFQCRRRLMAHYQSHDVQATCHLCRMTFWRMASLSTHMSNAHSDSPHCETCDLWFDNKWEFNKHQGTHSSASPLSAVRKTIEERCRRYVSEDHTYGCVRESVDSAGPVSADSVEPVSADSVHPASVDTIEPVNADSVEPVSADRVHPASVDTIEPVNADTVKPVSTDTVEPVSVKPGGGGNALGPGPLVRAEPRPERPTPDAAHGNNTPRTLEVGHVEMELPYRTEGDEESEDTDDSEDYRGGEAAGGGDRGRRCSSVAPGSGEVGRAEKRSDEDSGGASGKDSDHNPDDRTLDSGLETGSSGSAAGAAFSDGHSAMCVECGKGPFGNMKSHLVQCAGKRPDLQCSTCKRNFTDEKSMQEHWMRLHACGVCNHVFTHWRPYVTHQCVDQNAPATIIYSHIQRPPSTVIYSCAPLIQNKCNLCEALFNTEQDMFKHIVKDHSKNVSIVNKPSTSTVPSLQNPPRPPNTCQQTMPSLKYPSSTLKPVSTNDGVSTKSTPTAKDVSANDGVSTKSTLTVKHVSANDGVSTKSTLTVKQVSANDAIPTKSTSTVKQVSANDVVSTNSTSTVKHVLAYYAISTKSTSTAKHVSANDAVSTKSTLTVKQVSANTVSTNSTSTVKHVSANDALSTKSTSTVKHVSTNDAVSTTEALLVPGSPCLARAVGPLPSPVSLVAAARKPLVAQSPAGSLPSFVLSSSRPGSVPGTASFAAGGATSYIIVTQPPTVGTQVAPQKSFPAMQQVAFTVQSDVRNRPPLLASQVMTNLVQFVVQKQSLFTPAKPLPSIPGKPPTPVLVTVRPVMASTSGQVTYRAPGPLPVTTPTPGGAGATAAAANVTTPAPRPATLYPPVPPLTVVALFKNDSRELALKERMNVSWRSKATYPCRQCGAVSRQPSLNVSHRYLHRGRRQHRCHCGRTFSRRLHLLRHCVQHAEATSYVCTSCGGTFRGARFLAEHMRGALPRYASPGILRRKKERKKRKKRKNRKTRTACKVPLSCTCGQIFIRPSAYIWHQLKNAPKAKRHKK